MRYTIAPGETSVTRLRVRIYKDDFKANTTPLVYNSAGLAVSYARDGAADVGVTLTSLASSSAGYASGGFVHTGNGWYRIDLPNAAFAAGASDVVVKIADATNINPGELHVEFDAKVNTRVASGELVPADVQTINGDGDGAYGAMLMGQAYYYDGSIRSTGVLDAGEYEIIAERVEYHLVDEADGLTILNAIVGAIGNTNVSEAGLVALIRADLERNGGNLATLLTRLNAGRAVNLDNLDAAMTSRARPDQVSPTINFTPTINPTPVTVSGGFLDADRASLTTLATTYAALNTATSAIGGNVDELIAMTVGTGTARKFRSNALMNAPTDGGAFSAEDRATLAATRAAAEAASENVGTGNGDVAVDHNYGGDDRFRVRAGGEFVDDALVQAWTAYPGGQLVAQTRTGSDGRWIAPLLLDAGAYRLIVSKSGAIETINAALEVTGA